MTETLSYDWALVAASPGVVNATALASELKTALEFSGEIEVSAGGSPLREAGSEIAVIYPQALVGGEVATALATVNAHDGTGFDDVTDGKFSVPLQTMTPNPGTNQWADVPGASFAVAEGRVVRGTVDVSCYVGTTATPCGQHLDFECTRQSGQSVRISAGGDPNGSVSGFRSELTSDGPGVVKLRIRRRQTPAIQAHVTISRTTEILP